VCGEVIGESFNLLFCWLQRGGSIVREGVCFKEGYMCVCGGKSADFT
jgi:hypothetical protein